MNAIFFDCNEADGNTLTDRAGDIVLQEQDYREVNDEISLCGKDD